MGSKALFAGGVSTYPGLSGPRAGGIVTIYDDATGQVTSDAGFIGRTQVGAGSVGNLAFFAGGRSGALIFLGSEARVDIYNSTTNQWSLAELSQPRSNMGVASAGSKILFAGGASYTIGYVPGPNPYLGVVPINYNTIDIYDVATNQWSVSQLPRVSGEYLAAVSVGNQIWFAQKGLIDSYDVNTGQWSAASIPLQSDNYSVTRAGNKILFAGLNYPAHSGSSKVAIYDVVTGQWSESNLSQARYKSVAISLGNKAFFAGNSMGSSSDIDVYDATTNQWSVINFPGLIRTNLAATPVNNKLVFVKDGPLEINIYAEAASNTAPSTTGLANQTITAGQSVQLELASAFSDAETPGSLTFTATGLPTGLSLTGSLISGSTSLTGVSNVTVKATDPGSLSVNAQFTLTVVPAPVMGSLQLLMPGYDCQTGAFRFNTTGGDGSPIEYYAVPGITGWTTNPNQFVDAETRTAADAQPITLKARQNGQEVMLVWDIRAVCPVSSAPFAITAVNTMSCQAITATERRLTFTPQYRGLTSEPFSFSVVNEMLPTSAAGPYHLRLYTDNPVITLKAQQGNAVASYSYNWLAACAKSVRAGAEGVNTGLVIKVLGNPVVSTSAEVEVSGVAGQVVHLNLVDTQGKLIHQHTIEQAGSVDRVSVPVGHAKGLLLLEVRTATQRQQVKLLMP
ncbi:hypothetical protein GCM10028825_17870 [Spirosoma agri]